MTDPSSNKDINVPVRRKIPRPNISPPDMPTNCRFKPGQIVRLVSECGQAKADSIGIVDYYLPTVRGVFVGFISMIPFI